MPISTKIDGEWKDLYSPYAKIDGEWRTGNLYVKVNGVWKQVHSCDVQESDIVGFRMVYHYVDRMIHPYPRHPQLVPNKELPVSMLLTGEHVGEMDYTSKGVVFEFTNSHPKREGICLYEAGLYAVTKDGFLYNVGDSKYDQNVLESKIPSVPKIFNTDRLAELSITIDTKMAYQTYGFYITGWNNMFTTNDFMDKNLYDEEMTFDEYKSRMEYKLLPREQRENDFHGICQIGIARDMTSTFYNMVGAHGKLSQTITKISVDGKSKPFIVELYD